MSAIPIPARYLAPVPADWRFFQSDFRKAVRGLMAEASIRPAAPVIGPAVIQRKGTAYFLLTLFDGNSLKVESLHTDGIHAIAYDITTDIVTTLES